MQDIVKQKFNSYPKNIKPKMMSLRSLIYETTENTVGVGKLSETLKWGEPAYLTSKPKTGTRLETKKT